jgi:glycosyltransferase involved in cell wall biosynthesis
MSTPDVCPEVDLVCLSHLRWNFVFQRPQHLLTRCAAQRRVFYVEEPIIGDAATVPSLKIAPSAGVIVVTPQLPPRLASGPERDAALRRLLDECLARHDVRRFVLWYYTPMALGFSRHLSPELVVFDCMDELSAFAGAPAAMRSLEAELLARADVVFTGGRSLYEAKRALHSNVHAMPSSVDVAHFAQARQVSREPEDQRPLARPRLGYFGVIDERMDLDLLAAVADARPEWQLVMIGPVVKIDPAALPRRANLHYLGAKGYEELPHYIAFWDVALMPFARNESTRFISPTKTPEYLAAGKPVVSTSIRDVVRPYGRRGLVRIADDPHSFVKACEAAMDEDATARTHAADAFLETTSWDRTWAHMVRLMARALEQKRRTPSRSTRLVAVPPATGRTGTTAGLSV